MFHTCLSVTFFPLCRPQIPLKLIRIKGLLSHKTNNLIYLYWHCCWIRQENDVWSEKLSFALI